MEGGGALTGDGGISFRGRSWCGKTASGQTNAPPPYINGDWHVRVTEEEEKVRPGLKPQLDDIVSKPAECLMNPAA
jgi:hypothetical protein